MTLHLDGAALPLSQMADEWIILRAALVEDCPPCEASISLVVDERRKTFPVLLPQGISSGQRRISIGAALEALVEA